MTSLSHREGMNPRHQKRRLAALRLTLTDPQYNLREIAKQMLLLEDHLCLASKQCPDCIRKHLMTIEALAEEMVGLDDSGDYRETGQRTAEVARLWMESLVDGRLPAQVGQDVRLVRKKLVPLVCDPRDAVERVASRHVARTICPHNQ